ncbi:MAG: hypothetical protein NC120_08220 [Ruminococcus sp.]|nr:hypothetical protein [Ruminococcus sp.]
MVRQKQFLAILTACTMLFGLAGCQGDTVAESVDTEQISEQTTTVTENDSDSSAAVSSEEIFMPEGWSKQDFQNMIQLNGKTLTLPTTLNKLSEYDDFKFETEFIDENHELYIDQNVLIVYAIKNGICVLGASFLCDSNQIEKVLDEPVTKIILHKVDCEQAEVGVSISENIDFYSTGEQIRSVFGTPNIADDSTDMYYKFHDEENTYILRFEINPETLIIPHMTFEIKSL